MRKTAIGKYIAELVRDGDCLQLGIGAVPDAVCSFLGDKHDLGLHTEMISDGVPLLENGNINGKRKQRGTSASERHLPDGHAKTVRFRG